MAACASPGVVNSFAVPRPQTTPPSTSLMRTNHCFERYGSMALFERSE